MKLAFAASAARLAVRRPLRLRHPHLLHPSRLFPLILLQQTFHMPTDLRHITRRLPVTRALLLPPVLPLDKLLRLAPLNRPILSTSLPRDRLAD